MDKIVTDSALTGGIGYPNLKYAMSLLEQTHATGFLA